MRFQQVFDATEFKEVPDGGGFIIAISDQPFCGSKLGFTISNVTLRLSTTATRPDQLSPRFDDNAGLDQIVVCSEPQLTVRGESSSCPVPWSLLTSYIISTPFFYDPSKGNLLLDLQFSAQSKNTSFPTFSRLRDAVSTGQDGISTLGKVGGDQTTADQITTTGVIFQFAVAPMPELWVAYQTNTVILIWPYNTPKGFQLQSTEKPYDVSSWSDTGGDVINLGPKGLVLLFPDASLSRRRFFRLYWNTPQPGVPSPKARVVTPAELEQTQ